MGQALEGVHDLPGLGKLGSTRGAAFDVRHERSNAESGLAVEELIDFVW
jgi:hypothetical protein